MSLSLTGFSSTVVNSENKAQVHVDGLEEEISFVKQAFADQGFYPKEKSIVAYRGDSRNPKEIMQSNGFYRKAFGDSTLKPFYRPSGSVVHMIGCSTDFDVAVGFTKFPVHIQRTHEKGLEGGWVYAFCLPSNSYYDPSDYSNAFLGEWGKELDAIYIPADHIIGALLIEHPKEKHCIHSYLTHVPDYIHGIGGCKTPYVDKIDLQIKDVWINNLFSLSNERDAVENFFRKLFLEKSYTLRPCLQDSEHAKLIISKFDELAKVCKLLNKPLASLAVCLEPEVSVFVHL